MYIFFCIVRGGGGEALRGCGGKGHMSHKTPLMCSALFNDKKGSKKMNDESVQCFELKFRVKKVPKKTPFENFLHYIVDHARFLVNRLVMFT